MSVRVSRQALSRLGRSLAFRITVGVLLLYILYHCVAAFSDRVLTDVVVRGEQRVTVSGEATIFRDEVVYSVQGGPYLCSYPLESGAKVNAASTLAQLYMTTGDADTVKQNQAKLSALDRQISVASRLPAGDTLAHLSSIRKTASERLLDNAKQISNGAPMSTVADGSFELLLSLGRIGALTDQSGVSRDTLISLLRTERQRLLLSAGYSSATVTVADVDSELTGGYFYHGECVDGYENVFRRSALDTLTLASYDALLATPPTDYRAGRTAVGKLALSYAWSIVVPVDPSVSESMELGARYEVRFTNEYDVTLSMTLDSIIGSTVAGRTLAVLSSDVTPAGFDFTRFSQVEITLDTVRGYRVPETALREVDGESGVYILDGGRVSWRAVEILEAGEGYVLVYAPTKAERESEEDGTYHANRYVALRDVVITEGDDLYDGKYID